MNCPVRTGHLANEYYQVTYGTKCFVYLTLCQCLWTSLFCLDAFISNLKNKLTIAIVYCKVISHDLENNVFSVKSEVKTPHPHKKNKRIN